MRVIFESYYEQRWTLSRKVQPIDNNPYWGIVGGERRLSLPGDSSGKSPGRHAQELVCKKVSRAGEKEVLRDVLIGANSALRKSYGQISNEVASETSPHLPAATFIVVKVGKEIDLLYGGGCGGALEFTDGVYWGTDNQMFLHEKRKNEVMDLLTEKGEYKKGHSDYFLFLSKERKENVNKTYCLLNGQSEFEDTLQEVSLESSSVKRIILFSRDAIPLEWTERQEIMAKKVFETYDEGGLPSLLKASEESFKKRKPSKYRILPEATAICLKLVP